MTTPQLSIQLYTVREALAADAPATLDRLVALGFTKVEAFGFVGRAAILRGQLDNAGLASPSGHAQFLVGDVPPLEQVLDDAEAVGIELLIDPMVAPSYWATPDGVAKVAESLNAAAEAAAARGIRVGYHNHSQEFHHSFDGITAYETFISQLSPAVVVELDAFWATVGKQDVPALAARLGDRLRALHVKDGTADFDPFLDTSVDHTTLVQVPAGGGNVALDDVLAAAGSLELAVVEYDQYEGDIFEGIAGTVAYLAEKGIR